MFRLLLLTLVFINDSAQGMDAPWEYSKVEVDECAARVLGNIPGADKLADWRKESYSRYSLAANTVNSLLPEDRRLTVEQMERVSAQMVIEGSDEYLQAGDIFIEDMTDGKVIFPEYVDAVHAWLMGLAEKPFPSPEELEAANTQYRYARDPLNPIQAMRKAKLIAKLEEVEARLGQSLYLDRDFQLDHSARTSYNTRNLLEDLEAIEGGERPYSIADYQEKFSKIRVHLRDYSEGIPYALSSNAAMIKMLDNETIRREVDYFTSLENLYDYRFFKHRVRGWIRGEVDLQENIESHLKRELQEIYGVFATGGPGPHYMGELYRYSLYWAMQRTKAWENMSREELVALEEKVKGADVKIEHLGRASMVDGSAEMYGVELKMGDEVLYFAMQVRPRFFNDSKDADIENLKDIEIVDIRPLYRPARFQDGFKTYPIDLAEPLLKLDADSVTGAAATIPGYILISHLSPTVQEQKEMTPMETVREIAGQMGAVIFAGETPMQKPYVELKFFSQELAELPGSKMRLPLIEERTGMQLYQVKHKTMFSRVTMTLKRNVVSGKYSLTIVRENGAFGMFLKTGEMTADYRELRD